MEIVYVGTPNRMWKCGRRVDEEVYIQRLILIERKIKLFRGCDTNCDDHFILPQNIAWAKS